ncbi:MAG TPA: hypothetical protein VN554_01490, partial [Verrucomicrobiae bacterium]|nr:hypothetical protein [Verrucomicrobiae bacterium]
EEQADTKPFLSPRTGETRLTPPDEDATASDDSGGEPAKKAPPDPPAEERPAEQEKADKADDTTAAEPEKPDEDEGNTADEGVPDKAGAAKKAKKAGADAEAAAQAEQDIKLHKLVESKKYFLPINAVEQRRSARVALAGALLALILAVAWVDVALDAGLIHLGNVKPVTHLFSN